MAGQYARLYSYFSIISCAKVFILSNARMLWSAPCGRRGTMEDENVLLGEHIELSGFSDVDRASMVVVRKILGNYTRKFIDTIRDFRKLRITLKEVHNTTNAVKYEIHGRMEVGPSVESVEAVDRNIFYALDTVLKKLEAIAGKA